MCGAVAQCIGACMPKGPADAYMVCTVRGATTTAPPRMAYCVMCRSFHASRQVALAALPMVISCGHRAVVPRLGLKLDDVHARGAPTSLMWAVNAPTLVCIHMHSNTLAHAVWSAACIMACWFICLPLVARSPRGRAAPSPTPPPAPHN